MVKYVLQIKKYLSHSNANHQNYSDILVLYSCKSRKSLFGTKLEKQNWRKNSKSSNNICPWLFWNCLFLISIFSTKFDSLTRKNLTRANIKKSYSRVKCRRATLHFDNTTTKEVTSRKHLGILLNNKLTSKVNKVLA